MHVHIIVCCAKINHCIYMHGLESVQWRKKMFLDRGGCCERGTHTMKPVKSSGVWGHASPGKFLKFECSKINSGAF